MRKGKQYLKRTLAAALVPALVFSTGSGAASAYVQAAPAAAESAADSIGNLKVDYQSNPLGIDFGDVKFSWNMTSGRTGAAQKAYEITVTDEKGKVVWNKKADSGISTGIAYGGEELKLQTRYIWNVKVTAENGEVYISEDAFFETGTDFSDAQWIKQTVESQAAPLFRTEATLDNKEIASARLYMTSMGIYEAYINGQEVVSDVDDIFNPGWVEYNDYVNYQTYDVTSYVKAGENCIGAVVGNGWYKGRISGSADYKNAFGDTGDAAAKELALLGKLVVTYADGSTDVVTTDEDTWTYSNQSPYLVNDFYDGETFDANVAKAIDGWNEVGYEPQTEWAKPEADEYYGEVKANAKATARIAKEYTQVPIAAYTYNESENRAPDADLVYGSVVEHPVNVTQPVTLRAGDKLIVDMGQNMVGVSRMVVSGDKDTKVKQRFAEMLNDGKDPDGEGTCGSDGPKGTIYTASLINGGLGNALCEDTYILSGEGQESYRASLTYHGFRYIEISTTKDVIIHGIDGKVITGVGDQTGFIETSDANVNKLFKNALWGQIGNYLSVPTDCPQRAERYGWTGDAQLFAQTGAMNFEVNAFLENYIQIMNSYLNLYADSQGAFYGPVIPNGYFFPALGCGWSDAGVLIPWVLYQQNGDLSMIRQYYPEMDRYMNYVYENGYSTFLFGDWLAFTAASTQCINMEYQYYTSQLMAKMAGLLGKTEDVQKYEKRSEEVKEAFLAKYVDENGNLLSGSADGFPTVGFSGAPTQDNAQTGLLWALKLGLYDSQQTRNTMVRNLVKNIRNKNQSMREGQPENTLSVGFLGVNVILPVLTSIGEPDVAYDLLFQDACPSWLYAVKNGATTIWERWNSYSQEDSFGDYGMNSFNHYSYGACVEWMYNYMSGIKADENAPGYKKFILQPSVDAAGRLDYVNGSYESVYGTIQSNWTAEDGKMTSYTAVVPANTTATLYLPIKEIQAKAMAVPEGVEYAGMEEHNGMKTAKYNLQAGSYQFAVSDEEDAANAAIEEANRLAEEANKRAEEADKRAEEAKALAGANSQAAKEALEAAAKARKLAEEAQLKVEKLEFKAQKPSIKAAKSTNKKQAKISWKKITGADGYTVQYSTKANFKGAKKVTLKQNTVTRTLKKLKSSKKYYVRVRAYKTIGKKKVYTNYSNRKSMRVK